MIDTNELRRLAQEASPGPWISCGPSFGESLPKYLNEVVVDREGDEDDGYSVCTTPIGLEDQCSDNMAFIAAANPAAISEILDRLEAAEKERDAAELMSLALRAKIAEMGQQEPAYWGPKHAIEGGSTTVIVGKFPVNPTDAPLYALPGAQSAPSVPMDVIADYLVSISAHLARRDDAKAQTEIGELLKMIASAPKPEAKP